MKSGSTLFLKAVLIVIGVSVLALSLFGVFWLFTHPVNAEYAHMLYPIVIGLYLTVIPFSMALYQAFQLLNFIDRSEAFSQKSVIALGKIKICAIFISVIYVIILPFIYQTAQMDDAPGLIIIGTVPVFASIIIAVFAAVLQKVLFEATQIKTENDLTV